MSLQGKTAVVTGGARGTGEAVSRRLAAEGASIAVWDLDGDGAAQVAAQINGGGGRAISIAGDAADAGVIAAAAARTREELGPIAILVNNAGISAFDAFLDITEEMWDRVQRINLKGPFLCTQEVLPEMGTAARSGDRLGHAA